MDNRKLLIGYWHRSEINNERHQETEYALLSADGSYEFSFLSSNANGDRLEQSIERGDWGLVGDVHFTIAKQEVCGSEIFMTDLTDTDNYHAYKVLTLNKEIFKYRHIVSNEVFILKRVIDKISH